MTYHTMPIYACDEGCCIRGTDVDFRRRNWNGAIHIRPMIQIINDISPHCDGDVHQWCAGGGWTPYPTPMEFLGDWEPYYDTQDYPDLIHDDWDAYAEVEARRFIQVFRETYADLLEPVAA